MKNGYIVVVIKGFGEKPVKLLTSGNVEKTGVERIREVNKITTFINKRFNLS